jgi:CRISPR-associated protein Cas2
VSMYTYLICYDIEDDRERARVARLLERHGERVQYSVFEVHLKRPTDLEAIKEELRGVLAAPDAEVRFYRLTADALADSSRLDGTPLARRNLVVIL